MGKIVSREHHVVGLVKMLNLALRNTPGEKIPHLSSWILKILLHSESCLSSLVLARLHRAELSQRFLNGPCAVGASKARAADLSIL